MGRLSHIYALEDSLKYRTFVQGFIQTVRTHKNGLLKEVLINVQTFQPTLISHNVVQIIKYFAEEQCNLNIIITYYMYAFKSLQGLILKYY